VKASPLAAGTERIQAPGEPERAMRAERETQGVPIDPATWQEINDAALAVGMPAEQVERWSRHLQ
jgi:uncharacterized oxidoreductase